MDKSGVAGTGIKGMKALMPNDYISGINGYPDLLIFKTDWLKDGLEAIEISGFFGHNWGIDQGEFKFFTE